MRERSTDRSDVGRHLASFVIRLLGATLAALWAISLPLQALFPAPVSDACVSRAQHRHGEYRGLEWRWLPLPGQYCVIRFVRDDGIRVHASYAIF